MYRYFKEIGNTDHIGLSDEIIEPISTSNNSLAQRLSYVGNKIRVKLDGCCLKQDKITFTHGKAVNIYIVYEINFWDHEYDDYPTLENSLFDVAKLMKNGDIDKCKYSGCGIEFDRRGTFLVANGFGTC